MGWGGGCQAFGGALTPHLCYRPPPSLAEFSIWTREAGAGGLSIAVEGPSKAEIAFEDRKDGSCGVSYVVQEPGTGPGKGRASVGGPGRDWDPPRSPR